MKYRQLPLGQNYKNNTLLNFQIIKGKKYCENINHININVSLLNMPKRNKNLILSTLDQIDQRKSFH